MALHAHINTHVCVCVSECIYVDVTVKRTLTLATILTKWSDGNENATITDLSLGGYDFWHKWFHCALVKLGLVIVIINIMVSVNIAVVVGNLSLYCCWFLANILFAALYSFRSTFFLSHQREQQPSVIIMNGLNCYWLSFSLVPSSRLAGSFHAVFVSTVLISSMAART